MKLSFAVALALLVSAFTLIAADGNDHFVFQLACGMTVFGLLALNASGRKQVKAKEKKELPPVEGKFSGHSVERSLLVAAGMRAEADKWTALAWSPDSVVVPDEYVKMVRERLNAVRTSPAWNIVPPRNLDSWNARRSQLEARLRSGTISQDEAHVRYAELLDEFRGYRAPRATAPSASAAPLNQLYALSSEYGLPVETPLQKKVPLPEIAPLSGGASASQFEDLMADNGYTLPTVEDSLKGYVPDGQPDLLLALAEHLAVQVREARKTPFTAGRKRHWVLSPEWAAEVRKLRDSDGKPSWAGPGKFLRGYPVFTDRHAGVPELVTL